MMPSSTLRAVLGARGLVMAGAIAAVTVQRMRVTAAASSSTPSPHIITSSGLHNLGNTCYLNAQIQAAFHVPKVRQIVLEGAGESQDHNPSIALLALADLLKGMQLQATTTTQAWTPRAFCQALGIPIMEQQDSQEFWKLLLPALQLEPLTDLYQGVFEDYIVALDGSGRERRRDEPFLDISLDVASGSVELALQALFGAPELLSAAEGNGWRPEKDAPQVDAHKGSKLGVEGLPAILQLHLKRFQMDWNIERMQKINEPFDFPQTLDLAVICGKDGNQEEDTTSYELQAVIVHVGEYETGHYYVYVRPDPCTDRWLRFNDHVIDDVDFDEVRADGVGGPFPRRPGHHHGRRGGGGIFGIMRRLTGSGTHYGYGGRTSNAYVLQYVRRSAIDALFGGRTDPAATE